MDSCMKTSQPFSALGSIVSAGGLNEQNYKDITTTGL